MQPSQYSIMLAILPVFTVTFLCGFDPAVKTLVPLPAIRCEATFTQPLTAAGTEYLEVAIVCQNENPCVVGVCAKFQDRTCLFLLERAMSPASIGHAAQVTQS